MVDQSSVHLGAQMVFVCKAKDAMMEISLRMTGAQACVRFNWAGIAIVQLRWTPTDARQHAVMDCELGAKDAMTEI